MQKILAVVLLALHATPATPVEGSYLARTMNGHPIPAELRVPVTAGDYRLFRLEQALLRLGHDGHFTLYFRYYHQLVRRGGRPTSTPVMSDSERGTYQVRGGNIVLTPTRKRDGKTRPAITATASGEEVNAAYLLQSGGTAQRVTLTLRRDASYW